LYAFFLPGQVQAYLEQQKSGIQQGALCQSADTTRQLNIVPMPPSTKPNPLCAILRTSKLTNMKQKTFLTVCFFLFCHSIFSQDLLKLSADVYKSYDELKGAYDNLNKVQNIVKDIEKGEKPDINSYGSDWSVLANSYKKSAETIKNAKMVTDFDATPFSISINELNNCYIKDQNFNKLRSYKSQLDNAVVRGQNELVKVNEYKALIEQTFVALKYLIDVNAKLSSVPIYNQIFQWNWFDLETGVRPALGELSSAINAHEKKLRQEIDKVKTQGSNLSSNTTLLENSICLINGIYRGTCNSNNIACQVTLSINRNGSNYFGSVTYSNQHGTRVWGTQSISISNARNIAFTAKFQNYTLNFSGTLSQNYRTVMNFTNNVDRHNCNLNK
jgi:hypothetical protein